jgi:2-(1,2-epoxy-1,2-dihydrophenyl)acetyl-CoA isomerase
MPIPEWYLTIPNERSFVIIGISSADALRHYQEVLAMIDVPLVIERDGHVVHVQLNRPEVMNALDQALVNGIYTTFRQLRDDAQARVIVLSGSGRAFCAGGDVSFLKLINSQSQTGIRALLRDLFHKLTAITRVEKPVVGALHGVAVGAGFSLALLCDLRLAAEDTKFGAEFPMMGIIPEVGCSHILPNLVGLGKAMELVLTAQRFDAPEAQRIGVVNRVFPADKLMEEAMALAHRLVKLPPLALGLSKMALRKGVVSSLEESLHFEANINALCYQTEDHKEAASAFLEKRKPLFKGR